MTIKNDYKSYKITKIKKKSLRLKILKNLKSKGKAQGNKRFKNTFLQPKHLFFFLFFFTLGFFFLHIGGYLQQPCFITF